MTTRTLQAGGAHEPTTTGGNARSALGGYNLTFVGLELRRMLRNVRTVLVTVVVPIALFAIFGGASSYRDQFMGAANVTAYLTITFALYGAIVAATTGGAMVSKERGFGWSRQLRLTPLKPTAYMLVKATVVMSLSLLSIVGVVVAGRVMGAVAPLGTLALAAALAWLGSLVFAAFGLFIGYLFPSENVMQIAGLVPALLAFLGGLFLPLSQMGTALATLAMFTPVYGIGVLARYPLDPSGPLLIAALNAVAWFAVFTVAAAWRFRVDTARS